MNGLATTLSASEARANFYTILDRASRYLQSFTITRRGKPVAMVVSKDEREGWEETLEILSDRELVKSIHQGMEDIKHGRVYTEEEVFKSLGISKKDLKKK